MSLKSESNLVCQPCRNRTYAPSFQNSHATITPMTDNLCEHLTLVNFTHSQESFYPEPRHLSTRCFNTLIQTKRPNYF